MVLSKNIMICAHQLDVSCKKQLFTEVSYEISKHLEEGSTNADEQALALANQFIQRERLGSTAIGRGIALPHIISADISNMICCIATAKRPIEFDAADGRAVDLFGMLLLPEASANTASAHLEALRQRLTQRGVRTRLRTITSSEGLKDVFGVSMPASSEQSEKHHPKHHAAA